LFRGLWLGGFAVNLAVWLQTVGAAWLMTQLTPSPLMVALIQTASSLPGVVFGLVGGALADILDRRKVMMSMLAGMFLAAGLMSGLGYALALSPWMLLGLMFLLGTGYALYVPAFYSVGNDTVPPDEVPAALNLTSVAFNVARVVGPALGGAIVAIVGGAGVFALVTFCYLGTFLFLLRWKPVRRTRHLPPERLLSAMTTGLRYLRHTPEFQKHLLHASLFMTSGSAIWALLPVLAKEQLGFAASGYGLLLGCLGVGGVIGAIGGGWLRLRYSANMVIIAAGAIFAAGCLAIPHTTNVTVFCGLLVAAGMAWVSFVTTINVGIQISQPPWIRARAISLFALAAYLSMAVGAAVWGGIASHVGVSNTMFAVAAANIAGLVLIRRYPLRAHEESQTIPYLEKGEPSVHANLDPDEGPVLIQVRYQVLPDQREDFLTAIEQLGQARRRRGARFWRLYRDMEVPNCFVERYTIDTWVEHLRQKERITVADRMAEDNLRLYLVAGYEPETSHYLAEI
jgi:predicted MFS family arabinose efflux permease